MSPARPRLFLLAGVLALLAPALLPTVAAATYPAEPDLIEVMFTFGSEVRLRGGILVDLGGTDALEGVDAVLAGTAGYEWSRICDVPEETLDDIQARGQANSPDEIYNLNNIYRLRFLGAEVWSLSAELEALPGVMLARPVPLPMELPVPPDYQPAQNYEDPATSTPTGIDAEWAWSVGGGDGSGVTVCDIEYSWNYGHSDISKAAGSQINVNVFDPFSDNNHGTAVIGELVSDRNLPNPWGTWGVCDGATLKTCGSYFGTPMPSWNVPGAIAVAIAALGAGDVILLEQQWDYTGNSGYVPIEWWLDYGPSGQSYNGVYAAIVSAVAVGIHVVEAGGNGAINTDTMTWQGDSGAIIVGAGGAYPGGTYPSYPEGDLERLNFSSYGSRFNLQGWGEDVRTTGYGSYYSSEGVNLWYTNTFSGTSSASPIVAGAVACVQGYNLVNVSATPLSPSTMRSLLVSTGTPQYFGLSGKIGPRPNIPAACAAIPPPQQYDFGDAPEGALAYPASGIMGFFPTCTSVGPAGFIQHAAGAVCFGPMVDYEPDGNGGFCGFPPYDVDECFNDMDAGLLFPPAYTINATGSFVPCNPPNVGSLGATCAWANWGVDLDILVTNPTAQQVIVNVLMDWDQNGQWGGSSICPSGAVPEHVLINFPVPPGFNGPLSALTPPPFLVGPYSGFVWTRFTISDVPVGMGWIGAGTFNLGESEDYLLAVGEEELELGDAPEGGLAYPPLAVMGNFPTCVNSGAAGFVAHLPTGTAYFGPTVDFETEGNAGNCPNWPPYDADECFNDGDAGLMFPPAWTIDQALNYVPCNPAYPPVALGRACTTANWGFNLDIQVVNNTQYDRFVNVLFDWDLGGQWGGSSQCPTAAAPEHVLKDFVVPPGFVGPLSLLGPPSFLIGPNAGLVWSRFTISDAPVGSGWDGSGSFEDGETCDYLLQVDEGEPEYDYGDAPEGAPAYPSGIIGSFPTCLSAGPAGYVRHMMTATAYFGSFVDSETEGNAGNCPNWPPYDLDECQNDGDAGLLFPPAFSLDATLSPVLCDPNQAPMALGSGCTPAIWGANLDIQVVNSSQVDRFVNVLFDWNQDGFWSGAMACPTGYTAPEHVLVNFPVPPGYVGPLSGLAPPPFRIGHLDQFVWSRFTISDAPVPGDWDGSGDFEDGETCDYLIMVDPDVTGVGEPELRTQVQVGGPNPFRGSTTIRVELAAPGPISVAIYDVAGRRVRALASESRPQGSHLFTWDGRTDTGRRTAAGIYFVRLHAAGRTYTNRVIMLR